MLFYERIVIAEASQMNSWMTLTFPLKIVVGSLDRHILVIFQSIILFIEFKSISCWVLDPKYQAKDYAC